jgi:hypothetical protein
MDEKPKKHRHWFRFRLSTLLVVVALLASFGGWLARERRIVKERGDFAEAIFAKGGRLEWAEWGTTKEFPSGLRWLLRDRLGDYGFPVELIRVPFIYESQFRLDAERLFPEAAFVPLSQEEIEQEQRDREWQQHEEERLEDLRKRCCPSRKHNPV